MSGIKIDLIAKDDIFSEISHYKVLELSQSHVKFLHVETNKPVTLDHNYVINLLKTADQAESTVLVGKEDKFWTKKQLSDAVKKGTPGIENVKEGDLRLPGIRTIFENIYSSQVFTVVFQKSDTKLPAAKFKELRDKQINEALEKIKKVKASKKNVEDAADAELRHIQENPIFDTVPGELRPLRGYKVQFKSRDGRYDCVDLDLEAGESGKENIRPVNINTIKSLLFDGVWYQLEKEK